ncbi:threonine/serine exporter family protein [Jeongeupia naejangsanensis]|uniref:Threonine/serine exporter family protein n=1 Tax=Jeongeupia naejangsanensis TaxID=613195 RepID=A0ABS2BLI4_9NEIS|nr:threonine/serine exporter family protein [Jeongeupia naejangsanensis]MBM3116475.1 threonine/serine exporter family protein [Jeongeupia naejangsanensis]
MPQPPSPPPADPARIAKLALDAAVLVHQSGGDTARTTATLDRAARALGASRVDAIVSSLSLGVTVSIDGRQETALRRAPHMGVNFRVLSGVERAVNALEARRVGANGFATLLDDLESYPHYYPAWLVAVFVGFACGAFAALFHGDLMAVTITSIGSALGMRVRQLLAMRHFKPFVFAPAAAFVATLVVGLLLPFTGTPQAALAASVLFLIPGVPLINGAADLLSGSYLNALVRLTMGAVFVVGLALGMSVALRMVV